MQVLRLRWKWACLAGVGLLVLAFLVWPPTIFHPQVAVIAQAQDVAWSQSHFPVSVGASLRTGWMNLVKGSLQLDFPQGAQMVIEAPAHFRIDSRRKVFCQSGRFWVRVAPSARGFTLETEKCSVKDLGTEFGLGVHPEHFPEVHVFEGYVAVSRLDDSSDIVDLAENQAVRLNASGFTGISLNRAGFLTSEELALRQAPEVRSKAELWGEMRRKINEDSSAILHLTMQSDSYWSQILTNEAARGNAVTRPQVIGCDWSEGRWPGKRALTFADADDRIRLELPQRCKAFTSFIWMRVDGLPNSFVHSLMTGDSESPGTVRWTIHHNGTIRFGLANASAGPEASWAVGSSPAVIKKDRMGSWILLSLVFDGEKAVHYLNDTAVWSGSMKGPEELSFGWCEIGNWVASPDHPDFQWAKDRGTNYFNRRFVGRMDEVGVLTRVLSAEEIRMLYEAGRPLAPAEMTQSQPSQTH